MTEFHEKQRRIQALLESHKLDALLLRGVSSFAWAVTSRDGNMKFSEGDIHLPTLATASQWSGEIEFTTPYGGIHHHSEYRSAD